MKELSVAGIYVPPFLLYLAAAWLTFVGTRRILTRLGVMRLFWHPALAEIALLIVIVCTLLLHA